MARPAGHLRDFLASVPKDPEPFAASESESRLEPAPPAWEG